MTECGKLAENKHADYRRDVLHPETVHRRFDAYGKWDNCCWNATTFANTHGGTNAHMRDSYDPLPTAMIPYKC